MRIKNYFITGLIVWVPIAITVFLIKLMINGINHVMSIVPKQYHLEQLIHMSNGSMVEIINSGINIILFILLLFITGLISANWFAAALGRLSEKYLNKIPIVRTIYSGAKQSMEAILAKDNTAFKKVLLVEYPKQGVWSIAFLSNDQPTLPAPTKESFYLVFIPTTPNPTSGMLVLVPKATSIVLDMSIDQALRMIISLGTMQIDSKTINTLK